MSTPERGDNPFETKAGAENWIRNVEGYDVGRELLIYPRIKEWLATLNEDTIIADVGCGQGICASFMPEATTYIGFDPSYDLIKRAAKLYSDRSAEKQFFVGDAEHIAMPDSSVDAALSVHVWFHLADLTKPSQELARIVNPGGKIFVTTANPTGYSIWESWYSNKSEDGKLLRGTLGTDDFSTGESVFYRHSMEEIISALTDAGFSEPTIDEFGRFHKPTAMSLSAIRT